jgi:hypothetical protein
MSHEQKVVLSFYLPQKEQTLAHIETVAVTIFGGAGNVNNVTVSILS